MKSLKLLIGLLGIALFGGCASSYLDGPEMHHAYWSTGGVINVDFWKQPDGAYLVTATGDAKKSDEEILTAWKRFVGEIARGRVADGEPRLEEFEQAKGYSLVMPQRAGQIQKLKRVVGEVVFKGEIRK